MFLQNNDEDAKITEMFELLEDGDAVRVSGGGHSEDKAAEAFLKFEAWVDKKAGFKVFSVTLTAACQG